MVACITQKVLPATGSGARCACPSYQIRHNFLHSGVLSFWRMHDGREAAKRWAAMSDG
jgi:hypothetical protein